MAIHDDTRIWRPGKVEEPEAPYETVLTGAGVDELISRIHEGFGIDAFMSLQDRLEVTELELASLLRISSSTIARRKKQQRLTADESERLIRFARLFDLAREVFREDEDARRWLKTRRSALGGETPLQRASTEVGARQVEDLLGRIEYGVYS